MVWKRAAPYPSFVNFDAPNRGNCTVNRGRSNTPLQALTLLNDPAYTEMAFAFADRILTDGPETGDIDRIDFALRHALARPATERETSLLVQLLSHEREILKSDPTLVTQRTTGRQTTDPLELAAWFAVANALLNLDEVICQ